LTSRSAALKNSGRDMSSVFQIVTHFHQFHLNQIPV
jgi:hypothetical protein